MATTVEERTALRDTVRALVRDVAPMETIHERADEHGGTWNAALWSHLVDLGLNVLLIPEEHGGAGASIAELAVVAAELGRGLAGSAYLPTAAMSASIATAAHDSTTMIRIASGAVVTAAIDTSHDGVVAAQAGTGGRYALSGRLQFVPEGMHAELALLPARIDGNVALFALDLARDGVSVSPMRTLDLTRGQAQIDLHNAGARLIGTVGEGAKLIEHARAVGSIVLAAEQVAIARSCLESSVDYAKTRVQFGRPIGSFQAVKHLCAEILIATELADAAVDHASEVDSGSGDFALASATAAAAASDAAIAATAENIHVHGGIGFTWEHNAHLFFRRARANSMLLGDADSQRARIADLLGV